MSSVDGVHVVVVGGGFGGVAAAQQLRSQALSFTLIDTRDAFHHNVAALRAAVRPGSSTEPDHELLFTISYMINANMSIFLFFY